MVLLADEPTVGLEEVSRNRVLAMLRHVADLGGGVLLIEHNIQAVVEAADEVYVLHGGRMIFHGSPADMLKDAGVLSAYFGTASEPDHGEPPDA
jgi:ABC-type branched-subunit amino acid transport system ATPase component